MKTNENAMVLGGDIKELPDAAFSGDDSLVAVRIIPPVREISKGAFKRCSALESVEIEEGVEAIREEAFFECANLKRVRLPSSLRLIGDQAFRGCTSLEEIVFPEGLYQLGPGAFAQCDGIKGISLPSSLVKVGNRAFEQCMGLERVHVQSTIESECYCGFGRGCEIFRQCRAIKEVVFHEGVAGLPISIFTGCTKIETIKLPSTLKYVRKLAFKDYRGRPIVLPKGVSGVGKSAFGPRNSRAIVPWGCGAPGALLRLKRAAYDQLGAFIIEGERRLADPAVEVDGFCKWLWHGPFIAQDVVCGHEIDLLEVMKGHSRLLRGNLLKEVTDLAIQTWVKLIRKGAVEISRPSDAMQKGTMPRFFGEILRQDCENETWKPRKAVVIAAVFDVRSRWMRTFWSDPAKSGHLSPMLEAVSYDDAALHRELESIKNLAGDTHSLPKGELRTAAEEGRFGEFMLRLPMHGLEMDRHTIAMLFKCHAFKCIVSAYKKYDKLETQIPLRLVLLAVCQKWPTGKASEFVRFVEEHFPGLCANTVDAAGCSPLWYCLYNSSCNSLEIAGHEDYMREGFLVSSLLHVGCDPSKMNRFGLSFEDISNAFRAKRPRLTTPPTVPMVAKTVVAVQTKQAYVVATKTRYAGIPLSGALIRSGCPEPYVNALDYSDGNGRIARWRCAEDGNIVRLWIPAEVTVIENCAFKGCENLEEVVFENCGAGAPLDIGLMAFAACPKLAKVFLSERLVSIGAGAFRDCTALVDLSIPPVHGLIQMGMHAFSNCPYEETKKALLDAT